MRGSSKGGNVFAETILNINVSQTIYPFMRKPTSILEASYVFPEKKKTYQLFEFFKGEQEQSETNFDQSTLGLKFAKYFLRHISFTTLLNTGIAKHCLFLLLHVSPVENVTYLLHIPPPAPFTARTLTSYSACD